jgi:hypothetical protein
MALQQEAVDLVVRLFGEQRQLLVDDRLKHAPGIEAERRAEPAAGDDAREHMRAQDVAGIELLALLEHVHARAQIGEFPRRAIHHRQRQARAEDLVLDGVVVDQAQIAAGTAGGDVRGKLAEPRLRHRTGLQRGAQHRDHPLLPDRERTLQRGQQFAALQRHSGLGNGRREQPRALVDPVDDRRDATEEPLHIRPPRLLSQCRRVGGGGHGRLVASNVPEKVAFDSTPPLRRSDRSDRDPWPSI